MKRFTSILCVLVSFSWASEARQIPVSCGTYNENWKEALHLHRMSGKARKLLRAQGLAAAPEAVSTNRDAGQIAIIEDGDGVVSRLNAFNLNGKSIAFLPSAITALRYRFQVGQGSYSPERAAAGNPLDGLGDDDSRAVDLPFAFPFFGTSYRRLYVNSDGNLSMGKADNPSEDRSLGRLIAGPPRIAPLFADLDPSQPNASVRVLAEPSRVVLSWVDVPIYQDFGVGLRQSFQISLYPDGKIEFAYGTATSAEAVVGIAPGSAQGESAVLSFVEGSSAEFSAAIAERFTQVQEVDIVTAAQKFYQTHEDAYDYLVLFNSLGIPASDGAVAYEVTVRNNRSGYGDRAADNGAEFGSTLRLQSVMNMGPLSQYPKDPYAVVPARATAGDTSMSVIAHEAGHLFLAFASVRNPGQPTARPMLGRQSAHWAFTFNSEASLLEGNRIADRGAAASPRFLTTATVQGYSPLDQYFMGLRAPAEVPPTFLVENASISPLTGPRSGISFSGTRRDVTVDELIQAEGPRRPDYTVSQRKFRFAFVLITAQGSQPTQEQLAQVDKYRDEFEKFYRSSASDRASAETGLAKSLRVSLFPAAGVRVGSVTRATISTASALTAPLAILLRTRNGVAEAPASVTIPAGAASVAFDITGTRRGVEEISVEAADTAYEVVAAKIQVSDGNELKLRVLSGDRQPLVTGMTLPDPVVVKVTDENGLPYSGITVKATVTGGGALATSAVVSDSAGLASFRWTTGPGTVNQLHFLLDGVPDGPAALAVALGASQVAIGSVVNAASFESGIPPGGIGTIFGTNLSAGFTEEGKLPLETELAGVQVLLDGTPVALFYVSDRQINFAVPADLSGSFTTLVIQNAAGNSLPTRVPVIGIQPGVFFDAASGMGAILVAGTGLTTTERPAAPGEYLEIYATGLGQVVRRSNGLSETTSLVTVKIGNTFAQAAFAGLAPQFVGLYQVNVQVPAGVSGLTTLQLQAEGKAGNEVKVKLQ